MISAPPPPPAPRLPTSGSWHGAAPSFALFGAATLALQVVYLREMLSVFWGSEVVVGALLGSWLLLGGVGSGVAGPALARRVRVEDFWPLGLVALAVVGPGTVLLIRALPWFLGIDPGRLLSFWVGTGAGLGALAPAGILSGALFVLGTRACMRGAGEREGASAARAYLWDNVGSVAGGFSVTAALVLGVPSGLAAATAAGICGAAAAVVAARRRGVRVAALAVALTWALCWATPVGRRIDEATLALAFPGEEIVARRDTPAGQVVVTRRAGQTNLYRAGHFVGSPDVYLAAEESVHLPLLMHPRPEKVLLVGGVLPGWFAPALAHAPGSIDLLEADPVLADLLEERLGWVPGTRAATVAAPGAGSVPTRVRLLFGDARMFLRAAAREYDAVLICGGAPDTFAQHRLVSAEFFREARAALRAGGLLAFPVPGPRSFQNRPLRRVLASIRAALRSAFPDVFVTSLDVSGFLFVGADGPPPDAQEVRRRWAARRLEAREMVAEGIGRVHLGPADPVVRAALDAQPDARADVDFEPAAVAYEAALLHVTSEGEESAWSRWLMEPGAARGGPAAGAAVVAGLVLAWAAGGRRSGTGVRSATVAAALAGLAGLMLEVIWLDGFQIVRGNLYREAGAVLATFMAGAGIGTALRLRGARREAAAAGDEAGREAASRAAALGLLGLALLAGAAGWILAASREVRQLGAGILPLANLVTGACVGWTFTGAAGAVRVERPGVTGGIYGADLVGAAAGSYVSAGLFVPLLGLPRSGTILALVCAPAALRLGWCGKKPVLAVGAVACGALCVTGLGEAGRVPAPAPPVARATVVREYAVMGTVARVSLVVPAAESDLGERGFAAVFAAMERVNTLMSDYRDDSEVARVRALPPGGATTLDPWTAETLAIAFEVHRWTGGAFDPTIRPAFRLYRFSRKEEALPGAGELARAMEKVGLGGVGFDAATRTLTAGAHGTDLDFGGVAKGYANDRAAEALAVLGIGDALLAISGEILAVGARADGSPWRIGVRHPRDRERLAGTVEARPGEAFSTSGDYEKFFRHEGVRYPHVVDARTGRPVVGGPASATVVYRPPVGARAPLGRAGGVADALATGLLVLGPEGAPAVLRAVPGAEVVFLLETPEGKIRAVASRGVRGRLELEPEVECSDLEGK